MACIEFVGVDWGTSSFRAWHCITGQEQRLLAKNEMGMSKLGPSDYAPYLESVLREGRVPQTVPVLVCGMAGARDGWREVPYVKAPAGRDEIASRAATARFGGYACKILPGVCHSTEGKFDVMRGEETLLFGALSRGSGDGVYCLPGTHSKWCRVKNGQLQSWQTAMTGELFALLTTQSTLSSFCGDRSARLHETSEFSEAVRDVLGGKRSALSDLFPIRARALLDPKAETFNFAAHLSGLLIGQEIAGSKLEDVSHVILISNGSICHAYSKALGIAGMGINRLDSEQAVLAGLALFAGELFEKDSFAEKVT
ncbi:2-dehydro-3-deoxygalactonokinase [Roseobacter sp. EG26]|uniref:2-dehydro-3-deoxygalactonokinase n=1 Tax=Roseobacter sp. EG26 TaxID=3412477 RepID=UPI003CE4EC03